MEPMTIIGAIFGGFVTKLLPVWLTTVLLFVLLLVMSEKLWRKASSLFQRETALATATSTTFSPHEPITVLSSSQARSRSSLVPWSPWSPSHSGLLWTTKAY
jgi:hypothetical protein